MCKNQCHTYPQNEQNYKSIWKPNENDYEKKTNSNDTKKSIISYRI
jgi:hypothetical protein